MNDHTQWARYFHNHKNPCFINDKNSGKLLYCNDSFIQLYELSDNWEGKKFSDVFPICSIQASKEYPDWDHQDVFETQTYNKDKNTRFLVKSSKIFDKETIFTEIISLDDTVSENAHFEDAMTRCVEIFQDNTSELTPMLSFTQLLTEFYNAELAYVYRFHNEDSSMEPLTSWLEPDFTPLKGSNSSTLGKERIFSWFLSAETPSITLGDLDDADIDPVLHDIISTFMVRNVLFSKVLDSSGNVIGVVGVSNRRNPKQYVDFRFISTISRFVAQDVLKENVDATIFQLHYHDSLTRMYNRVGYGQKIDHIMKTPPKSIGILSVNMNGLKLINENAGISAGDEHIRKSADLLKKQFDFEFYRLSGDEFVGIAPNVEKDDFENQILTLHDKMHLDGNYDFSMGHSWGSGNFDIYKLVQEAEVCMYINKQEYYSSAKRSFDSIADHILADLLSYLDNDEFMVYLQPQIRLKDGTLHGAEALIRRFDKTNQKMVFPDQFIPLYEQKSIIRHVDMFVVDAVCKLLKLWIAEGKAIPISVNLSRVTLQEFGIVDNIVEICDKYQIPHKLLVIEVTERVGLIENNVATSLITDFKKHGFSISLDDFGCAYSNIVTLAQIEVDEVKLDKSLVDEVLLNKKNTVIVESVLSMCNKLENTSTLAEGIEEKEQADLLLDLTCCLGQGYFFSRPIPVSDFTEKYMNSMVCS